MYMYVHVFIYLYDSLDDVGHCLGQFICPLHWALAMCRPLLAVS